MESSRGVKIGEKIIRRPRRTPAWAWVLYAVLALVIVGFIVYQVFSIVQQTQERNRAFAAYYSSLKCSSLCPVESIANEEQGQQRLFDASCQSTCERTYLDALSEHERSLLNSGDFLDDPDYASFINATRAYAFCYSQMISNMSFSYFACFQDLFFRVQKEVDLSEVRAPKYPLDAFSVVDFSCNPGSITLGRIRGTSMNVSLVFILEDIRGERMGFTASSVPLVGKSQTYSLTLRGLEKLSKIAFFAQDTSDNRKLTNELWKKCSM